MLSLCLWWGNKRTRLHGLPISGFLYSSFSHLAGFVCVCVWACVQIIYSAGYFVGSQLTSKVQHQRVLSVLVFWCFYHGSKSWVFICQQGNGTVKLQNLRERKDKTKSALAYKIWAHYLQTYSNRRYFPAAVYEKHFNMWEILSSDSLCCTLLNHKFL